MNTLDASQLIDAGRDVKTPFRLLVSRMGVGQVEILVLSVLRLLPARRLVAPGGGGARLVLALPKR